MSLILTAEGGQFCWNRSCIIQNHTDNILVINVGVLLRHFHVGCCVFDEILPLKIKLAVLEISWKQHYRYDIISVIFSYMKEH
jgi:hypothetical protein